MRFRGMAAALLPATADRDQRLPFPELIEDQPREGTPILNMIKEPYFRIREETETID